MVGMVIGMLGIIVMMQMFSVFEGQKRTTTGGDEAISSGAISLYGIQRNMQQSGWGSSALPVIGCTVNGLLAGGAALPLVPVTINSALIPVADQDLNTDSLLIVSGNGNGAVEGANIDAVAAPNTYQVFSPPSFNLADRAVAVPQARPAACGPLEARAVTGNGPNVVLAGAAIAGVIAGDRLFNLGAAPSVRAYRVRNQTLTVCDFVAFNCALAANINDPTIWVPIADNVVSLRAQYGRDTAAGAMDGIVDVWDRAVPPVPGFPAGNTATACAWLRVSAVRIALVARSSQPEKTLDWPAVTVHVMTPLLVNPALDPRIWIGNDAIAQGIDPVAAAAVAITLPDPDPAWPTWQDYRYKVFQTVVPLRNITTQGAISGC